MSPPIPILEGLVTTVDPDGSMHLAPMGPRIGPDGRRLLLRPFPSSHTFRNLKIHGEGVFHVTDDVLLLAKAALGEAPLQPHRPAELRQRVRSYRRLPLHGVQGALARRLGRARPHRGRSSPFRHAARLLGLQSRQTCCPGSGDRGHAAAPSAVERSRGGVREMADHRRQDRWPRRTRGVRLSASASRSALGEGRQP